MEQVIAGGRNMQGMPNGGMGVHQIVLRGRPTMLLVLPRLSVALVLSAIVLVGAFLPITGDWIVREAASLKLALPREQVQFWLWVVAGGISGLAMLWVLSLAMWLKSRSFEINMQQIIFAHGLLNRSRDIMELYRVRDVQVSEPFYLRPFGYGHCIVVSTDPTTPYLPLEGVRDPNHVAQLVRELYHQAMGRSGVVSVM